MGGIQAAASWSEVAEEDLVSNIGQRERTRQEVLFEIVASEERFVDTPFLLKFINFNELNTANRYVIELLKLKETFIDPLLHPFSAARVTSLTLMDPLDEYPHNPYYRSETPLTTHSHSNQPRASLDNLPIASRFLSSPAPDSDDGFDGGRRASRKPPTPNNQRSRGAGSSAVRDDAASLKRAGAGSGTEDEDEDEMGRGYARGANRLPVRNSPYGAGASGSALRPSGLLGGLGKNLPFPTTGTRSHQSLPPPPRQGAVQQARASTTSLVMGVGLNSGRPSNAGSTTGLSPKVGGESAAVQRGPTPTGRFAKRFLGGSRKDSVDSHVTAVTMPISPGGSHPTSSAGLPPHLLPEDLRTCLEVLESGILQGHITLSDGLKKRYEEQSPLVRSLADVFVANVSTSIVVFHMFALHTTHFYSAVIHTARICNIRSSPRTRSRTSRQRPFKRQSSKEAQKARHRRLDSRQQSPSSMLHLC
jgi:hypothetical protein